MESNRLAKVEEQVKKDLAEIFRKLAQDRFKGLLLSVTRVRITPDLGLARVMVSIFPAKNKEEIINWVNEHKSMIKNELVKVQKGQLRKMPELNFYLDESIDKEESIDKILKGGGESPIK